jgi:hypothetical protein
MQVRNHLSGVEWGELQLGGGAGVRLRKGRPALHKPTDSKDWTESGRYRHDMIQQL